MNVLFFLTPKSETAYLQWDCTVRQALEKMDYHKFTVIPLLNEEGEFISTISEGDILRFIKNNCNFDIDLAEDTRLSEIDRYRPYQALTVDASIKDVIDLSMNQNFIPIVDDRGVYIGIVKRRAVIEYFYKQYLVE